MPSQSRKPSNYPAASFHTVRFFTFVCAILVAVILAIFTVKLHDVKRKLPIAFLVQLIASALTILYITITTILYCCHGLSARLSLALNILLSLVWAAGLALFSIGTAKTILTTCSTTYWGNTTGITACRTYKAVFAFTIVAVLGHILAFALDIVARRRETHRGVYGRMPDDPKFADHDRNSSSLLISDGDLYHRLSPLPSQSRSQSQRERSRSRSPGGDGGSGDGRVSPVPVSPVPPVPPSYSTIDLAERHHAGDAADYYDTAPTYGMGMRDRTGRPRAGTGDSDYYYNGHGYGYGYGH